jgi:hypothetical protein
MGGVNMSEQSPKNKNAFACANTFCGAVSCLFVCAMIAFIAYLVVRPPSAPVRRLWIPVVVETNGEQTVLGETRQLEFWTPSARTKDYVHKEGGEVVRNEKWLVIPSDDAVIRFGAVLHSNRDVLGYRRIEEWGQGRTSFKPGWWWTLTVFTNYSAVELTRTYQNFWQPAQPVYLEVIDNRGGEAR